jgi:hypothetical protein
MLCVVMLSVFMLSVFMLSVFMLSVFMLSVFMLSVFMLSVFMLSVEVQKQTQTDYQVYEKRSAEKYILEEVVRTLNKLSGDVQPLKCCLL